MRREKVPTEDDEPIWRHSIVQLETLLRRCDGAKDRESVDTGLDVGGSAVFFCEQLLHTWNLILGRDNEGDHACSVATHHQPGSESQYPRAISRLLMSFFTFHTAIFLSATDSELMLTGDKSNNNR
jgi:hypothetical protein